MSSEFFRDFQNFSEKATRQRDTAIRPAAYRVLDTLTYYKNDNPGNYGSDGVMRQGNHPFFSTDLRMRAPITPEGCPDFINFELFVGATQSLNSAEFWHYLLATSDSTESVRVVDRLGNGDAATAGRAISHGNRNLYNPFLVLLGAGVIYGRELRAITTKFDKTYTAYPAVEKSVSRYQLPVLNADELRLRLIEQLGTSNQKGIAYREVTSKMKGCPAPKLLESVMQVAGDYFDYDSSWNGFARRVLRS